MLQFLMISFICSLNLLSAHPVEEPTKFTLGIQNNTENTVPSKLDITEVKFFAYKIHENK